MNAINRFRIAPRLYSLPQIKEYYDSSLNAINCEYSSESNSNYYSQFFGLKETEVQARATAVKQELSHLCSLCVMAYIESLFRIDSYIRVKHKYKGDITSKVKTLLVDKKSIPLVRFEDLLAVWAEEYTDDSELFRSIKNSFKFRHWIAHGRYWQLDDNIVKHFAFTDMFLLAQEIESTLGYELRTQESIGEKPHKIMFSPA